MDKDINERLRKRASQHFLDSIAVKQEAEKVLPDSVAVGVLAMVECLRAGGKVMACGNGGSAADAQHFAAELIGRFERERQELAAIALTTDTSILTAVGTDYSYDEVFSKQVRGRGKKGDILLGISTSGNSKNVLRAIEVAKEKGMKIVGLTGKDGGKMAQLCDVEIRAPHSEYADRAQEIHIKCIHSLIDYIERNK